MEDLNLNFIRLAGITLLVTLAISLGVGKKVAQAQTLFGLAHLGVNGPSTLYTIDTTDGTATAVGPTGFDRCSGMDFNSSGTLFATCERAEASDTHVLIIIDPETGVGAQVRPTGVGSGPFPLSILTTASDISFRNSGGVLYAHLRPINSLWTIDVKGSPITVVGETFVGGSGNGIAFSPDGVLFHADEATLNILNKLNGAGTLVAGLDFSPPADDRPRINAMDFQPGTGILFASLNDKLSKNEDPENYLATIDTIPTPDPVTDEPKVDVTIIGSTVDGLDAIAFAPVAAAAPKAEIGDFKCYKVKRVKGTPKFEEVEVTLDDEFDSKITRVRKPESICIPVSKDGGEIPDPTVSLTCYKIKDEEEHDEGHPKFKGQDVVVNNQFGDQQALILKKPKLVCVPSTVVPEGL